MYLLDHFPYLLLCARNRVPAFPGWYCAIHPYNNGFAITRAKDQERYRRIKGSSWGSPLVIDPVGLNPNTLPAKIERLLKDKLNDTRRWNEGFEWTIIFLCEPTSLSDVHVALLERFSQLRKRNEPTVDYWFPEMGIRGFYDVFHYHLPILSPDDLGQELDKVSERICELLRSKSWGDVSREVSYLQALVGYERDQKRRERIRREAAT